MQNTRRPNFRRLLWVELAVHPREPAAVSMESLHAILSHRARVLVIDSASTQIQVGLLRGGLESHWETSSDEAGTGIFAATDALLARVALRLEEVDAFVFCEGPGSVLGIRTAAVALRMWSMLKPRPLFAYGSLDLVARYQLRKGTAYPFSVIADARRESWHLVSAIDADTPTSLQRVKIEALSGLLLMPENFRSWAVLPQDVRLVPYSVASLFATLADAPIFRETSEPDAFLHEQPVYQTWTPRVHRAPS